MPDDGEVGAVTRRDVAHAHPVLADAYRLARRVAWQVAPRWADSVSGFVTAESREGGLSDQIASLRERVEDLEQEIGETRRLQERVAKVTAHAYGEARAAVHSRHVTREDPR